MNGQMDKIDVKGRLLEGLFEAERMRISAEQYINVLMPISNERKLLVRALERIYLGIVLIINRVLQFEHSNGMVKLSKDKDENLKVFLKLARSYGLNGEDIKMVNEILIFGRKHRESGMEFSRKKGFIILDDDLRHYHIDEKKVMEFSSIMGNLILVVKNALKSGFRGLR
jgi:hypothetical protein